RHQVTAGHITFRVQECWSKNPCKREDRLLFGLRYFRGADRGNRILFAARREESHVGTLIFRLGTDMAEQSASPTRDCQEMPLILAQAEKHSLWPTENERTDWESCLEGLNS